MSGFFPPQSVTAEPITADSFLSPQSVTADLTTVCQDCLLISCSRSFIPAIDVKRMVRYTVYMYIIIRYKDMGIVHVSWIISFIQDFI